MKGGLIRLIGALVLLIMMYPMFGYLILPAGLLLLGVNAVFRKILKKLHKQVQETDGNLRIFPQYYGMLASAERIREIEECFSFTEFKTAKGNHCGNISGIAQCHDKISGNAGRCR